MDKLYQLFQDCTVRLSTPGDRGTGFFVAPGLILTCNHVVKNAEAKDIEVCWQDKTYSVTQVEATEEPDLALLQVEIEAHPCVFLDEQVNPFDRLYSYGYPPDKMSNSALCQCEGISEDGQILSIVSDTVRPGLSGAPLLNNRTQKVCGMVKSELKVQLQGSTLRSFGGKAIPTAVIWQQWQHLKGQNQKFHQHDGRWQAIIPKIPKILAPNNLPYSGVFKFVGREKELEILHQQLQKKERVSISSTSITGMGGIGKTELALQYALRYWQQHYQGGVCWLQARDREIGTQIINYGRVQLKLNLPEDLELQDQVAYCWRNWKPEGDILVVLDDVTSYQAIKPYLPPNDERFKVIVTTRLQKIAQAFEQLHLEVLSEDAALELLESLIGQERVSKELAQAKALCQWLGYLPLGLELVGQYLAEREDLTVAKMQQRLENKRLQQKALQEPTTEATAQKGVRAAFELSWQALKEEEQKLACFLSLFALAPIPWSMVEKCLPDTDEEDLEDMLDGVLVKKSLLQRAEEGNYQLHHLVQEFLREKLDDLGEKEQLKKSYCKEIVSIARQIPETTTLEEINRFLLTVPHLEEGATNLIEWLEDGDLTQPFVGLGRFYKRQGLYQEAEPWYKQCLSVTQSRLGPEHLYVALSLNNLAELYRSQGRYSEAEPLYVKALAMRRKLLGQEHPSVALSLNNLALLYNSQERYSEAEPLCVEALAMRRKLLGSEHPSVAKSLNNLATLYCSQGRYSEAKPLYVEALAMKRKLLRPEHPSVAKSLNNLAALYKSLGRYEQAEPLYVEALAMRRKLLGEEHPHTKVVLKNLEILREQL